MGLTLSADPAVTALIGDLRHGFEQILDDNLVAIYLYGSLVTGDFDPGCSDVDLLTVTAAAIDVDTFRRLDAMHARLAKQHTAWAGRIEVAYVSTNALATFRTETSLIAVISPGEPFHEKEAGIDWLINWYSVLHDGLTLYGPPPRSVIGPISHDEWQDAISRQASEWSDWVEGSRLRKDQAFAILTLCRALYAHRHGRQGSKVQAAEWAAAEMPEWAAVIRSAVRWREDWRRDHVDHDATFPTTLAFVRDVIRRIVPARPANSSER